MTPERKYFHDLFGGEAYPGCLAPVLLLVVDPASVKALSRILESVTPIADHYEFRLVTGRWQGMPVSLCSTGIGGGSATIAIDNLVRLGAATMISIDAGASFAGQPGIWSAIGAARQDGASLDYVRPEFPAAADPEVLLALQAAAREMDLSLEPAVFWASAGPLSAENQRLIQAYCEGQKVTGAPYSTKVVITPPEPATLLTLATIYRLRAGAIYAGLQEPSTQEDALQKLFLLALSGLRTLQAWDTEKTKAGWKIMTPPVQGF